MVNHGKGGDPFFFLGRRRARSQAMAHSCHLLTTLYPERRIIDNEFQHSTELFDAICICQRNLAHSMYGKREDGRQY